jgi:hypothetical protein
MSCLTALTQLQIENASWAGFSDGLRELSVLTALQDLTLGSVTAYSQQQIAAVEQRMRQHPAPQRVLLWDDGDDSVQRHWKQHGLPREAPDPALQRQLQLSTLSQLTRLVVDPQLFPSGAAAPLSCLVQLQELDLSQKFRCGGVKELGVLARLPASLTHVRISWLGSATLDSRTAPSLQQLTALECLHLLCKEALIVPDFLSSMQQLQELWLSGLHRHALQPLLQGMQRLTSLRSVQLEANSVQPLQASQLPQYSALLPASEQLSKVVLDCQHGPMLAPGSLQHIFAAHRPLPGLIQLHIGKDHDAEATPLAADVAGLLVACCPSLQQLRLTGGLQLGAELGPLQGLADLTGLTVGGPGVDDCAVKTVLAQMQGLRRLELDSARGVTDVGLRSLTALLGLTTLNATGCNLTLTNSSYSATSSRGNIYLSEVSPVSRVCCV